MLFAVFPIDQPPLIEGDIIDDDDTRQKMEAASRGGAAAFDALNGGKWANGVVPYVFGNVGKILNKDFFS